MRGKDTVPVGFSAVPPSAFTIPAITMRGQSAPVFGSGGGKRLHDAEETDAFFAPQTSERLSHIAQGGAHRFLKAINAKLVMSDADRKRLHDYATSPDGKIFAMNHASDLDVITVLEVGRQGGFIPSTMGTVELFQSKMMGLPIGKLLPKIGGLSVNRKARDKSPTINEAQKIVRENKYPLYLCPEGFVTNANRTVFPVKDGASQVAVHNAREGQKVSIIPISVYYHIAKDLTKDIEQRVTELEKALSYQAPEDQPIIARIEGIFDRLAQQREEQYGAQPVAGENAYVKLNRVREHVVDELECRYLNRQLDDKGTQEIRARRLIGHIRREIAAQRAQEPKGFKRIGYKPSPEYAQKIATMKADAEKLEDVIDLSMYQPGYPLDNGDAMMMVLVRLKRDIMNREKWLEENPLFQRKYPVEIRVKVGEPIAVNDIVAAGRPEDTDRQLEGRVSLQVRKGLQAGIDAAVAELPH